MDLNGLKYIVVGSGFFGSVLAERIAAELGEKVLVVEKRGHTGGNCYSEIHPETGIEYHKYGTHIFHTSDERVWKYINRFTEFNGYVHQVLTTHKGKVYQMPVNLETINAFYGVSLRPYEVDEFLQKEIRREYYPDPANFEEKAVSLIGRPLYEAFIKGYSTKQWQKDLRELPADILERLPFRKNYNESYYFSRWQGIPLHGFSAIFAKLLSNPKIDLLVNTDFFEIRRHIPASAMIFYSGPLDRFFEYKFGRLEWRTLEFIPEVMPYEDFQGTSVMNFADMSVPYTRIHEPRHLHPERDYPKDKTLIIREYPHLDNGENPFYPVNDVKNQRVFRQYRLEATSEKNVIFNGRLGDYKYLDMHQTIGLALETFEKLKTQLSHGNS